jgi:hypothetical protein
VLREASADQRRGSLHAPLQLAGLQATAHRCRRLGQLSGGPEVVVDFPARSDDLLIRLGVGIALGNDVSG